MDRIHRLARRGFTRATIRYDEDQLGVKYPLVAPLAALSGGIVVAQFAAFSRWETLLSILLLALLSLLGLAREGLRAGAAACLACFMALGILVASRPAKDDAHSIRQIVAELGDSDDPVRLRGWVRVPPENLEDADRFVLEMESAYRERPTVGGVRVTVDRDPGSPPLALEYGQRVEFLARLRPPRNFENPGSFDWVNYLAKQDVQALADVREGVPMLEAGPNRGHRWMSWLWAARVGASQRLQSLLPETDGVPSTSATILRALLLGESTALDRDTRTRFQRTGTYHALVVSGLHVGVLAFGILWILRLAMIPALPRALLATAAVGAYVLLAGGDVPVARAGWMFAAYLAAAFIYRQRRALNILALAALGFLITMPELLFDAGFQLSFVSVGLIAGIAVPILEATLDPRRRALADIWNRDLDLHLDPRIAHYRVALRNWLEPLPAATGLPRPAVTLVTIGSLRCLVWIGELLIVSFVIQVGLALLMVVHFQRFSWGGLSANVPVLPLTLIAVPAGLAGLVTGWDWLLEIATWAAGAMNAVVEWHERHLPMDIRVPPPPLWLAWLFGLCLIWVAVSWERGRGRGAASVAFALSLALVVAHPFRPQLTPGRLELSALDVGQGESLFLALPGGGTMLLDGGGMPDYGGTVRRAIDIGEAVVSPYLWSRSIRKLDVVAISHAHADHMAGIPAVLENFKAGEVWIAAAQPREDYATLLPLLARRGIPLVALHRGEVREMAGVLFEVLGPAEDAEGKPLHNDDSLVLRARYGRHSFLLTGDIEQRGELRLVEEDLLRGDTVLKVAHHGSRTSSQPSFLERVRPAFAVISAGFQSPFGHPHPEVVERLHQGNAAILRTDREGLVTVASDGRRLFVSTFRRERVR